MRRLTKRLAPFCACLAALVWGSLAQAGELPELDQGRRFALGLFPIPQQSLPGEATPADWHLTFEVIGEHAEVLLYHPLLNGAEMKAFSATTEVAMEDSLALWMITHIAEAAEARDLRLMIVIDPLNLYRTAIWSNSFGTSFDTPEIRQAFKNFAWRVARDFQPAYLGLGAEVNTYFEHHPDDMGDFVSLYEQTYDLVKAVSPETTVLTSFHYESLVGIEVIDGIPTLGGEPQWEMLEAFDPERLDAVGITSYPSIFFPDGPETIPDNHFAQIALHTDKPIILAELGWLTSEVPAGSGGSDEFQRQFLERLLALTADMDLELLCWTFFHDWDWRIASPWWWHLEQDGEEVPTYFDTMGLRTSDGTPKPAWQVWEEIASAPLNPPRLVHADTSQDDGPKTHPHTGYIDPRLESADGRHANLGLQQVTLVFSEPVRKIGGDPLDPAAFEVRVTGKGLAPTVEMVDAFLNPVVVLTLSDPIPLQEWTTIEANVQDLEGHAIVDLGDLGPEEEEPDRIDLAFLPADVDQNGTVTEAEDLQRWRDLIFGVGPPPQGMKEDYLDTNRNGTISPFDLLYFRQLVNGVGLATRVWAGETLHYPRP